MSIEVFPLPPSGPSLAEITSAITSNAAPSTVTMPAITSSITTNAASSGVTIAAITSAGNSAGWGAIGGGTTWTAISTPNIAGTNTVTFSGLSGYKYYRLEFEVTNSGPSQIAMRLNGNTSNGYSSGMGNITFLEVYDDKFAMGNASGTQHYGFITIDTASLTGIKTWYGYVATRSWNFYDVILSNRNITAPLSSIQFFTYVGGATVFNNNGVTLYGGN